MVLLQFCRVGNGDYILVNRVRFNSVARNGFVTKMQSIAIIDFVR